jgi:hypothetical protein
VPPRARACPDCGADENSGWAEETRYLDGVDLPEADEAELRPGTAPRWPRPAGLALGWWLVALALLLLFAGGALLSGR